MGADAPIPPVTIHAAAPKGAPRRINYRTHMIPFLPSEAPTRRPSDPHQGVGGIAISTKIFLIVGVRFLDFILGE